MPPDSVIGWIVYVLGAIAIFASWFIPTHQLRSGLAGILLLITGVFAAYFHLEAWVAPVCAIAGVICLAVFWFTDPTGKKKGGI